MNAEDITRLIVIVGYVAVFGWSATILITNHLNVSRRIVAWLTLISSAIWVAIYMLVATGHVESAEIRVYLSRIGDLPVIMTFLVVLQTMQLLRDRDN